MAVVQAEESQLTEAKESIDRALDFVATRNQDIAYSVFGRMAEQLQLREQALAYYQQIHKPESDTPLSNYQYAQQRILCLKSVGHQGS